MQGKYILLDPINKQTYCLGAFDDSILK